MNRQIETPELGALVLVKGEGLTFRIISGLLSLLNPSWRKRKWKPWHTFFICGHDDSRGWLICEALGEGVCVHPLANYTSKEYRMYRWFDSPRDQNKITDFVASHLGQKYDILVYPLTALAYLARHYWGRPVPRLFDNSWSCWELVYYFADRMGQSFAESYDFPMINELLDSLES